MQWTHQHLLCIDQLCTQDILTIFATARHFDEINRRPVKKVPLLKGKSIVLFFGWTALAICGSWRVSSSIRVLRVIPLVAGQWFDTAARRSRRWPRCPTGSRKARAVGLQLKRRKMMDALVPPNPKELLMPYSRSIFLLSPGV